MVPITVHTTDHDDHGATPQKDAIEPREPSMRVWHVTQSWPSGQPMTLLRDKHDVRNGCLALLIHVDLFGLARECFSTPCDGCVDCSDNHDEERQIEPEEIEIVVPRNSIPAEWHSNEPEGACGAKDEEADEGHGFTATTVATMVEALGAHVFETIAERRLYRARQLRGIRGPFFSFCCCHGFRAALPRTGSPC